MNLTIHLNQMPRLRMCGVTPPFPYMLHGFLLKCRTILLLLLYLQIYVLVLKHLGLILKLDEKQIFMINTNKKSLQHGIRRHIFLRITFLNIQTCGIGITVTTCPSNLCLNRLGIPQSVNDLFN